MTRYRIENEDFSDGVYHIATAIDARFGPGYDPGSGIPYENDVFVMNSFWDNKYEECTCGLAELEWSWPETHPHSDNCYQAELVRRGFYREWYALEGREDAREQRNENDRIAIQLAREYGVSFGSHTHCTCGRTEEWVAFQQENKHTCGMEDPLFLHKPTGLTVSWYKRIGRDTKSNMDMKVLDWYRTVIECIESVRDDERREI